MLDYRIYTLGQDSRIARAEEFTLKGDDTALIIARSMAETGRKIELWRGSLRLWQSEPVRDVAGPVAAVAQEQAFSSI